MQPWAELPSVARPVTVSIVSHGHGPMVQALLAQLGRWCATSIDRVVITLNVPESIDLNGGGLPFSVEVIRNPIPKGFGSNHNAAFSHCKGPWFLVLNPDVALRDDVIDVLLAAAQPRTALLAPRVLEPGKRAPEPPRDLPTLMELFRRRVPGYQPPAQACWVPGLFMLLRSQAYRDLKGFDERHFMYCEDVDLCLRLQLAGWELQVPQQTLVWHEAARLSHRSPKALAWHVAGLFRLWRSASFRKYRRLLGSGKAPTQTTHEHRHQQDDA